MRSICSPTSRTAPPRGSSSGSARPTPLPLASAEGPRIETERLILRPLQHADLGPIHELYADRDVMRYIGQGDAHSRSLEDSERRLERLIRHQEEHGFSLWAVTSRETGSLMGNCGLFPYAHRGPEVELGYALAKPYWGKGYATEAAAACLRYGFDELRLGRIVAVAHPENTASLRVLDKIGMRPGGAVDYDGKELLLFSAEREPSEDE